MEPAQQTGTVHGRQPGTDRQQIMIYILAGLVALSLAVNLLLLVGLTRARAIVRQELAALATQVASLRSETITLSVPIERQIPIQAEVPVRESLTIPIDTVVAIDTQVSVPINTPLGSTAIDVPVRGNFPVKAEVPVAIDSTFAVNTTVSLDLELPINIPIAQTSLAGLLDDLSERLARLSEEL